jgi:hypothetical protein
MISGSYLKRLKAKDFNMCKCGHTRFWHEGKKCLMSMQNGEGNEEFFDDDCCQCVEFQLVKSIVPQTH